jgi:hypothetical protein
MVDNNKLIKVRNRNKGTVGYTIPDLGNLHRNFQPEEVKEIPMEELKKLSWLPGGEVILKNHLIIDDKEALNELIGGVEPEYFYTEKEIEKLLRTGTMDQFMDCLEFAPEGVIELVKDLAVKIELNDIQKREAIFKKTGFNVTSAININKESMLDDSEEEVKTRRAAPITEESETEKPAVRRTTSKYEVVSIKE